MNERERILDLVKKGVLSTEEALDLLESMAQKKDAAQIQKVADAVSDDSQSLVDHIENKKVATPEEAYQKQESEDEKNLEEILAKFAEQASGASAELDEVETEIAGLKVELKEKQECLMEINTKEELDELADEDLTDRAEVEAEIQELEDHLAERFSEKSQLEAKLKDIRKNQWEEKKEHLSQKFDIPEDWKEQANETMNQVGEKMTEAGFQFGKLFKKTVKSITEAVNDNVEWKDMNVKIPGMATTKFDHTFTFPNSVATLIDIKLANGKVTFKESTDDDIRVEAKIKLYGKMDGTPFAAFMERSQIEVDEDEISFQIPNKRVAADLVFYLPQRVYDHVSIKLLNGDIVVDHLEAKDVYAKSTNGNLIFNDIDATMLEIVGVNGTIQIKEGHILDSIIETVNGVVIGTAAVESYGISIVNGDVKLTITNDNLKKVQASSVNGNVKVAVPSNLSVEGVAKTHLGSINERLSAIEVVREKKVRTNQLLEFRRVSTDNVATLDLSTTTGGIFLKDSK